VLLQALSEGLGLPPQTLTERHANQSNELRLTHYPPVSRSKFANATRIATHTDFGTITLLFQDSVGGLRMYLRICDSLARGPKSQALTKKPTEVEMPSGSGLFVDVESGGRYECIVNAGDCLQKWTGLHSTRHRVHLPKTNSGSGTTQVEGRVDDEIIDGRFSIAYFAKPDRSVSLRPLLSGASSQTEEDYMTAGEFQQMRINGTYASG
jgi:isopenicillin N synthase-like dioxygenase